MRWWPTKERDADLDRELQSDLELEEEEQRERGLPPDEARYAARRALGNTALIKDQTHEAWGWAQVERFFLDLRFACRALLKSPIFATTAIIAEADREWTGVTGPSTMRLVPVQTISTQPSGTTRIHSFCDPVRSFTQTQRTCSRSAASGARSR